MSEMRDVFVVGAGPSAFAFVSGLRKSGFTGNITIFSGENRDAIISRDIFNVRGVSPKQLQDKFIDSVDGFTYSNGDFYALSTLGIGGGARFWGASIAGFDSYSIKRNGLDFDKYNKNLKTVNGLFGISTQSGNNNFFDDSVKCIFKGSDFLNIDPPNLAVEKNLCTMCGRCIAGCPYDAIWVPTINDFKSLDVEVVSDYITSLCTVDGSVSSALGLRGQDYQINGDIFLALNPISFYKLISSTFKSASASIGVTPSVAFAIPRFSRPASQLYFGMGIATLKVIKESRTIAYGNVYDGRSLSHSDIKIFSTHNNFLDSLKKRLVQNFWLGLLFTSSDNVDCRINSHGIIDVVNQSAAQTFSYIKKVVRSSVDWYRPIYFNLVKPGADLHYCNGVPDNISIDSETGKMEGIDNLFVVGAPNFKYLPPESPTMSFMANSYGVAVEYVCQ